MRYYKKRFLFITFITLSLIAIASVSASAYLPALGGEPKPDQKKAEVGSMIAKNYKTYPITISGSENKQQTQKQQKAAQFFSLYYQPRKNLWVGVNNNLELMQIAAAHSADFKHNGYMAGYSDINNMARNYFQKYHKKDYEKDLFNQSMDGVVNKLYHGETDYILCYNKNLDGMIFSTDRPDQFAKSGALKNKDGLIRVIKDFRKYTRADTFFSANTQVYKKVLADYQARYGFDYVGDIQELTGLNMDNAEFILDISPSMEGGMAVWLRDTDGRDVFINITNPTDTYDNTVNTIYHEGIHNYLLPVMMKRWGEYDNKRFTGVLYQNTGDNGNSFNETLTRALTVLIIEKNHPEVDKDKLLSCYVNSGWINTDKIYELLKSEYINNRVKYKTLEDFLPRIVEYLEEIQEKNPNIVKHTLSSF